MKKNIFLVLSFLILTGQRFETFAQCTTSCMPLNETFGSFAGCTGSTTQSSSGLGLVNVTLSGYIPGGPSEQPGEGEYAVRCSGDDFNWNWFGNGGTTMTDHTVDAGGTIGNFLMINSTKASVGTSSEFYHRTIS